MNVVQRPAKGGAMLVFATGTLSQCRLTRTGSSELTLWVTGAAFLITEAERARIAATFPSLDGAKAVRT